MKEILKDYCSRCKAKNVPLNRHAKGKNKEGDTVVYFYCVDCNTSKMRAYRATDNGMQKVREAVYRSVRKFQFKQNARAKVRRAVVSGRLKKLSCESCGDRESQAHHKDYSNPLDVLWLCRSCHCALHKKLV